MACRADVGAVRDRRQARLQRRRFLSAVAGRRLFGAVLVVVAVIVLVVVPVVVVVIGVFPVVRLAGVALAKSAFARFLVLVLALLFGRLGRLEVEIGPGAELDLVRFAVQVLNFDDLAFLVDRDDAKLLVELGVEVPLANDWFQLITQDCVFPR